jgi:hypothetical protein
MGFGIALGREYRGKLSEQLEFRFGMDLFFSYTHGRYEFEDQSWRKDGRKGSTTQYRPCINLIFGFNYLISDRLLLGADIQPHFSYTTGTRTEQNSYTNEGRDTARISAASTTASPPAAFC